MHETNATVDFLICLPFSLHVPTPRVRGVGAISAAGCLFCAVTFLAFVSHALLIVV